MTHIDAQTLQELIDANGAALTLYARQWCHVPEDAVQEALIELVRQTPPPENPAGWLYTVVRRRAMNLARAEARREKHQRRSGEHRREWFVPVENANESQDCQTCLAGLPRLEREIVVARIWGERTFAEIAALVELPLSTVHRRYRNALAELERLLNELEDAEQIDARPPLSGRR